MASCPSMASITEFAVNWRLPELVCVMAAWEVIKLTMDLVPKYDQYVPPNNAEGINGYPVKLESEWCLASNFTSCGSSSDTTCCQAMEAGTQPGQTVNLLELFVISCCLPVVLLIGRQILMKRGLWSGSGTFMDTLLGLLFSIALTTTITDAIEVFVGRPRPNYFALRALNEYGSSDLYTSTEDYSIASFPSGHCSESMAGTFYVTLLCWCDLGFYAGARQGWRRSLLAYLSILPALISIWIGVTRIRQYWNFQDDVLAGWALGAISAAISIQWITFYEDKPSTPEAQNTFFASITDMAYGSVEESGPINS